MCTVQVLLFAEVMRHDGNIVRRPGSGVQGVCRRLFAADPSTDSKDPSLILKTMEEQLMKRDKLRWNFDFQVGTPLPGRYQWVPVNEPISKIPEAGKAEPSSSSKVDEEPEIIAEVHPQPLSSSIPKSKSKRSCAGTISQPKITDYMAKRKRPLSVDEEDTHKTKRSLRNRSHFHATVSLT